MMKISNYIATSSIYVMQKKKKSKIKYLVTKKWKIAGFSIMDCCKNQKPTAREDIPTTDRPFLPFLFPERFPLLSCSSILE